MATVRFRLRSKANKMVSIYVYLSLGRNEMYQTTSGFSITPKDWSSKAEKPLQNSEANRLIHSELSKLESFLFSEINKSQSKGEIIDTYWLKSKVKECFQRVSKADSNMLVNHIQYFIDNASTRKIQGGKVGLSQNRIKGLITFKNKILEYQKFLKKQITFLDINNSFSENFKNWLLKTKNYKVNYAGKIFDNLKTICLDADSLGIPVHPFALKIQGFKEKAEDRTFVTLKPEELLLIRNLNTSRIAINNAKKWILLGCEFGQRTSDLMALKKDCFQKIIKQGKEIYLTNIIQKKTKKTVTIGTDDPYLINIIENDFPYSLSHQRFNKLIKDVCENAGINEVVFGSKNDKTIKRKVNGNYKKYELITSHCFRRSFATNYDGNVERIKLMKITGHTKESQFLEYINANVNHEENLLGFFESRDKMVVSQNEDQLNEKSLLRLIK